MSKPTIYAVRYRGSVGWTEWEDHMMYDCCSSNSVDAYWFDDGSILSSLEGWLCGEWPTPNQGVAQPGRAAASDAEDAGSNPATPTNTEARRSGKGRFQVG